VRNLVKIIRYKIKKLTAKIKVWQENKNIYILKDNLKNVLHKY